MASFPFDEFKKEYFWAFNKKDKISLDEGSISLSQEFEKTFPTLSKLVRDARVLDVKQNADNYKFLSWTMQDSEPCGWYCLMEDSSVSKISLLPEHELLLKNIGGIMIFNRNRFI